MFANIGWGEILVLLVAGMFILGPERLPGAARWLARSIRQVRDYASGASEQLRSELGQEYDELRKPLEELREPLQEIRSLRNLDPKRAITKHLLDDYDPVADVKSMDTPVKPNGYPAKSQPRRLSPGERPPFDPDAT
ncbi:MAG: Sec-independent protein translocase subunit TatB [Sciscionella sp.]|nr:Sec-independent protein translocase subunit TatB [Sciscionella sp.]